MVHPAVTTHFQHRRCTPHSLSHQRWPQTLGKWWISSINITESIVPNSQLSTVATEPESSTTQLILRTHTSRAGRSCYMPVILNWTTYNVPTATEHVFYWSRECDWVLLCTSTCTCKVDPNYIMGEERHCHTCTERYCRTGYNCECLIIVNCEFISVRNY